MGSLLQRESCTILARQPDGCCIYIKARGNSSRLYDANGRRHILFLRLTRDPYLSDVHPRLLERSSRHGLEAGTNFENRMASVPGHFPLDLPKFKVGNSYFRFVREPIQPPAKQVRFTLPGQRCHTNRRAEGAMATRSNICVPSSHDNGQSSDKNPTREAKTPLTPSTKIQQSHLVPVPPTLGTENVGSSNTHSAATPATLELHTPERNIVVLDSVAHKLPKLTNPGYSNDVRGQLRLSRTNPQTARMNLSGNCLRAMQTKIIQCV